MRDEDDEEEEIVIKRGKDPRKEFNRYDATGGWLGSPEDRYEVVGKITKKKRKKK